MSKRNVQNAKPETVEVTEVEKAEVETVEVPTTEVTVETVDVKTPFWKRPKVQKVGKIVGFIAAVGTAGIIGAMLGRRPSSDDEDLTEEDYVGKLQDYMEGFAETDALLEDVTTGESECDNAT